MTESAALLHLLLVAVHALAATVALVGGVLAVHTGRGFRAHVGGLVVMAVALGPSLAVGWPSFPTAAKGTFLGLAVLALVMLGRAGTAARVRASEVLPAGRRVGPAFVGVLGFNLVALTVAGTVVPVLRLDAGPAGVAVAVAVTVVLGHLLVARRVRAVSGGRAAEPVTA